MFSGACNGGTAICNMLRRVIYAHGSILMQFVHLEDVVYDPPIGLRQIYTFRYLALALLLCIESLL